MMNPAIEAQVSVKDAVALLNGVRRRAVWRLAAVRGLWVGLTLIVLCFYLDAVMQLGSRTRLGLNLAAIAATLAVVVLTQWRLHRTVARDKMLARLVESEHPEIGNDLTNAIDFEHRLDDRGVGGASPALMRKGIERAVNPSIIWSGWKPKPPTLRQEYYILAGVLAVWMVSMIVFSGWMFTELPRFLSPYADHPPYSATQLIVDPAGAVVDYGKALTVKVTTRGRTPKDISLLVRSDGGGPTRSPCSSPRTALPDHRDIRSDLVYWAGIEREGASTTAILQTPRIESVRVHYRYPAYSRLQERNTTLSEGDSTLKAYKGTEVTMNVASNRPLGGGAISIGNQSYPCTGQPDNTAQVVFPLTGEGDFSLSVTDVEGNVSASPFKGKATIIPDNKPMISITSPAIQSLAIPTAKIPILIEAQDDLGISDVSVYRSFNESDDARKRLMQQGGGGVFVNVWTRWTWRTWASARGRDRFLCHGHRLSSRIAANHIHREPYKLQIISRRSTPR
jgi:hypothetical protein